MNRPEQENDRPEQSSRRGMLKQTAAAGAAVAALGLEASAQGSANPPSELGQERPDQAIDRLLVLRTVLGLPQGDQGRQATRLRQHRADGAEVLPVAQAGGPLLRDRHDRHGHGSPVRQGIQQPEISGTRHQGHSRLHRRLRRAWIQERDLLHGYAGGHPRRRRRLELRRGLQADRRLRREEGRHALPGDAQLAGEQPPHEGPSRLPGRPHRLLHRHHQAGRLAQPETPLRHLSRPDHGRRYHHPNSPAPATISPTSIRRATPAAASSTTSRKSTIRRSWRPSSRSAIKAMSARSSSRPATRSRG